MKNTLTEARHDLANTTLEHLESLNEKLSTQVSAIPVVGEARKEGRDEDDESVTSDPTEMFHVDAGVQTSDVDSQASTPSTGSRNSQNAALNGHMDRLASLRGHLSELSENSTDESTAESEALSNISDVERYLDGLTYQTPYYSTSGSGIGVGATPGQQDDEIASVKTEIRSFKGVLLSARNFPGRARGGGGNRVGVSS
jgi:hypothetical protein